MRVIILPNKEKMGQWTSNYIVSKVNQPLHEAKKNFVLGLPTGSTPIPTYKALIKANQEQKVSFKDIVTFNMDEYVGLDENHPQSYHYFMHQEFFNHIDITKKNINILNGCADDVVKECEDYEKKIKAVGGINLFLGGIGSDGHIAFNEPGSSLVSRTREKTLNDETRLANARFFDSIDEVPKSSLTVGLGTIMDAQEVVILANGLNKAKAIRDCIEGSVSHFCTASVLQMHPKSIFVCDEESISELKVSTYKYFKNIEKDNLVV